MTDREKLIKVLMDKPYRMAEIPAGNLAEHLLAHGVTVREPGEWIYFPGSFNLTSCYRCSNCGKRMYRHDTLSECKFCPNCGAAMTEGTP